MMRTTLAVLALLSSTHAQRLVLNEYTDVGEQDLDYTDLDEALEEYGPNSRAITALTERLQEWPNEVIPTILTVLRLSTNA